MEAVLWLVKRVYFFNSHGTSGASHDVSDGKEKIENHILDFVKTDVFKFDT